MYYSISIKLHAECNKDNIAKILERGAQKGFRYYDEIGEIKTGSQELLDTKTIAQKIIDAHVTKPEYGPWVKTILEGDSSAFLGFRKTDDGFLEIDMGGIGCAKKKIYFIDFDYYIRMCLDLCTDFQILEVRTTLD